MSTHTALVFSLATLDKSFLISYFNFYFNLVSQRLVRLVLRLALLFVLALSYLLFTSCLLFEIWIAFGIITFHVWHFIIRCVAPYSQNQTSTKISTSSPSMSESFVRKAVVTVILKLCFHRYLIQIKVKKKKKNLLDASIVLIQALIRSPEHMVLF